MTEIRFTSDGRAFGSDIRTLLELADDEFHPPLSGREGTTQTSGLDSRQNDALDDYHEDVLSQLLVLAIDGDDLAGFLSFRHGYEADALGDFVPANYVSTIIVHPDERRQGHGRSMYEKLLTDIPDRVRDPYVTTRTWSTNHSHLSLLDELGFRTITTIEDDRGDGIDTVYYGIPAGEYAP